MTLEGFKLFTLMRIRIQLPNMMRIRISNIEGQGTEEVWLER
jgi:hypothetical protein